MQVRTELGRYPGTKDGNPFLFFHLENPMDWEYPMVRVCVIQSVRQDCSDLTHEISLERMYVCMYYTCSFHILPTTCSATTTTKTVNLLISFQSQTCVQIFVSPWITPHQASLSITISQTSGKHMFIEKKMPSSHLILCHSLRLLIQIPPIIRDFYESVLRVRWPMYWSFSFSLAPSKEHPRLIS